MNMQTRKEQFDHDTGVGVEEFMEEAMERHADQPYAERLMGLVGFMYANAHFEETRRLFDPNPLLDDESDPVKALQVQVSHLIHFCIHVLPLAAEVQEILKEMTAETEGDDGRVGRKPKGIVR
jgi:hypothetical protein